jgi:tRNA(His) 5'-end guanylyltransferase
MSASLGDRMKKYENVYKVRFTDRLPIIVRLDGKAFHTLTHQCEKPFDYKLTNIFNLITLDLFVQMQGSVFAYTQSDEISILLYPWKKLESQAWFDNEMNKINTISASIVSAFATQLWGVAFDTDNRLLFDARSFILPESEVVNYFIWRQKDWIRNSVQMLGRAHFSQKELHGKTNNDVKTMLEAIGVSWNDLPIYLRYGRAIYKNSEGEDIIDKEIPLFTENRSFIEKHFLS